MLDFCAYAKQKGPVGPFGIRLTHKAYKSLGAGSLRHYLVSRINWVEDALRVVIGQMLSPDGRVSDYFLMSYPDSFAESQRRTESRDQRHTLLYRLRLLLRCLMKIPSQYQEVGGEAYASLKKVLDVFVECVHQAVDGSAYKRLRHSTERFDRLWSALDPEMSDDARVVEELQYLLDDDVIAVFEQLRIAFGAIEAEWDREQSRQHDDAQQVAAELRRLSEAQEAATRESRSTRMMCERLAAGKAADEADDPYSRLAGLDRIRGAKRTELLACFRYSHEKFAVERGDKSGAKSLKRLAERVWRDHRDEYEAYAKLSEDPGYKDERSLAAKLYKLAANYPQADHFRWQ